MNEFIFNNGIPDLKQCPICGNNTLHLYSGGYYKLRSSANVGKCIHSTCEYHFTEQQYINSIPKGIPFDWVTSSQRCMAENGFVRWLDRKYNPALVTKVMQDYYIGSNKDRGTIFWQIDSKGNVREGLIESIHPRSGISESRCHYITAPGNPHDSDSDCKLFGEHLISKYSDKPIIILTDEKTCRRSAIESSIIYPGFLWLACATDSKSRRAKVKEVVPQATWI